MENREKIQIKPLEMTVTVYKMKSLLDELIAYSILQKTVLVNLKTTVEMIQNETENREFYFFTK